MVETDTWKIKWYNQVSKAPWSSHSRLSHSQMLSLCRLQLAVSKLLGAATPGFHGRISSGKLLLFNADTWRFLFEWPNVWVDLLKYISSSQYRLIFQATKGSNNSSQRRLIVHANTGSNLFSQCRLMCQPGKPVKAGPKSQRCHTTFLFKWLDACG